MGMASGLSINRKSQAYVVHERDATGGFHFKKFEELFQHLLA